MSSTAAHLAKLSRLANGGGVLLAGGGVYVGCRQIAAAEDRYDKNEIMLETLASTVVSLGTGVLIGAVVISGPVGWGVAILLGSAGAVGSWGAGKLAGTIYDRYLREVDFVGATGIDQLCK